jgi:hypothetical protein
MDELGLRIHRDGRTLLMPSREEATREGDPSTSADGRGVASSTQTGGSGPSAEQQPRQRELEDRQLEAQRERQQARRTLEDSQRDAQRERQEAQRELEDRQREAQREQQQSRRTLEDEQESGGG